MTPNNPYQAKGYREKGSNEWETWIVAERIKSDHGIEDPTTI